MSAVIEGGGGLDRQPSGVSLLTCFQTFTLLITVSFVLNACIHMCIWLWLVRILRSVAMIIAVVCVMAVVYTVYNVGVCLDTVT